VYSARARPEGAAWNLVAAMCALFVCFLCWCLEAFSLARFVCGRGISKGSSHVSPDTLMCLYGQSSRVHVPSRKCCRHRVCEVCV